MITSKGIEFKADGSNGGNVSTMRNTLQVCLRHTLKLCNNKDVIVVMDVGTEGSHAMFQYLGLPVPVNPTVRPMSSKMAEDSFKARVYIRYTILS